MERKHLDALGDPAIRKLARQLRLPGWSSHPVDHLRLGLATFFAAADDDTETDADPEPGDEEGQLPTTPLCAADIPPALATETMARLLEAQGRGAAAQGLRLRLTGAPPPPPQPHITLVATGPETLTASYRLPPDGASPAGSDPPRSDAVRRAASALRLTLMVWYRDGHRELETAVVADREGTVSFELAPGLEAACALLEACAPGGNRKLARSAVWSPTQEADPARPPEPGGS